MKRLLKTNLIIFALILAIFSLSTTAFAHPGRTDGSGGHRDNQNKSGLGYYHYHCGGYPAHLHESGYCPYTDIFPSKVVVKADSNKLRLGAACSVTATVAPSNACDTSVSWKSSDSSVATVSGGKIIADGYGTATLTASTFNGKTSSITITVEKVLPHKVTITNRDLEKTEMHIGDSHKISAIFQPEEVDDSTLTWTSSDTSVANVVDGKLCAYKHGKALITVTAVNGVKDTIAITITEIVPETLDILLPDSLNIGENTSANVTIQPDNAENKTITWTSSDTAIANVSDGKLYGYQAGNVVITAETFNGIKAAMEVRVNEVSAEKIEITGQGTLLLGDTAKFSASVFPQNTSYPEFQWKSSDETILTIDEDGNAKALQVGTVTVSAIQKDITETVSVEVLPIKVEKIDITCPEDFEGMMESGQTLQFHADVSPQNATYPAVIWSTSDSEIAEIDENGLLTALSSGTVTVSAKTSDGAEATIEITVAGEISTVAVGTVGIAAVAGTVALVRRKKKKLSKI